MLTAEKILPFLMICILGAHASVLGQGEGSSQADSLMGIADGFLDENRFEEAVVALKFLENNNASERDSIFTRKVLNNLGYSYYFLLKYDSSTSYYQKALLISRAKGDSAKIPSTLKSIGLNLQKLGLYGLAVENYREAVEIVKRSSEDKELLGDILNSLAIVYHSYGNFEKSLTTHRESLKVWETVKDSLKISFAYNNIARGFMDLKAYDSSLHYNFKALEIKKYINDKQALASTVHNIGVNYMLLDSLVLAEKYLADGYRLHRELQDLRGLILSLNNLADVEIRKGDNASALGYLRKGREILDRIDAKDLLKDHLELMVTIHEDNGDFKEAFLAYKEYTDLKEALFQDEKLKVQEVESAYILREKEAEKARVVWKAEMIDLDRTFYLRTTLYALLGGAVLILLTALLIRSLHKSKKQSVEIAKKNNIIKAQQTELKHRTNNLLSRVINNIRGASRSLTDKDAIERLQAAERMALAAASLEEYLYHVENEKEVLVSGYLKVLTQKVMDMHHLDSGRKISVEISLESECYLSVEKVINIGLITVELITNAVKHAFQEVDNPTICITLSKKGKTTSISVKDNGRGSINSKSNGIGHQLISELAHHIQAEIKTIEEDGISHTITITN